MTTSLQAKTLNQISLTLGEAGCTDILVNQDSKSVGFSVGDAATGCVTLIRDRIQQNVHFFARGGDKSKCFHQQVLFNTFGDFNDSWKKLS